MSKDNGGPAFPTDGFKYDINGDHATGMTLRDYFAAKAMQGLIPIWNEQRDFDLCKYAYNTADAMLAERTK